MTTATATPVLAPATASDRRAVVVGDLIITSISPDGAGVFAVTFCIGDGGAQTVKATARDLESFAAFRRLVCSEFSCWPRHDAERGGRRGRQAWLDDIEDAFQAGRVGQ
jgi:hypothetical protein